MRRGAAAVLACAATLPRGSQAVLACLRGCRDAADLGAHDGHHNIGCRVYDASTGEGDTANVKYCSSSDGPAPSWCSMTERTKWVQEEDANGHQTSVEKTLTDIQPAWCMGTTDEFPKDNVPDGDCPCNSHAGESCEFCEVFEIVPTPMPEADKWTPTPGAPPGGCESATTEPECDQVADKSCRWLTSHAACKDPCPVGSFGDNCERTCTAQGTCSGHGQCNGAGTCNCAKGWTGEDCKAKLKDSCKCSAWGDPHYTDWSGWAWDMFGEMAYEVYGWKQFHVTTESVPCSEGAGIGGATCNGRVNLYHEAWGDGTSVEVDKKGNLWINCQLWACPPTNGMTPESNYQQWGAITDERCKHTKSEVEAELGKLTPPLKVRKFEPSTNEWGNTLYEFEIDSSGDGETDTIIEARAPTGKWATDVYVQHFGHCSTYQGPQGWGGVEEAPFDSSGDRVQGLCNGPKDPLVKKCYKGPKDLQPADCGALLGDAKTRLCNYDTPPGPPPTPAPPAPAPVTPEPPPPVVPVPETPAPAPETPWPVAPVPPETPKPPVPETPTPEVAPPSVKCPAACQTQRCNEYFELYPNCEQYPVQDPQCTDESADDMKKYAPCCARYQGECNEEHAGERTFHFQCMYDHCMFGDPFPDVDSELDADDEPLECLTSVEIAAQHGDACPCTTAEGNHPRFLGSFEEGCSQIPGDCEEGWWGNSCDRACSREEKCSGHGVCDGANGLGTCTCDEGWENMKSPPYSKCGSQKADAPETPAPETSAPETPPMTSEPETPGSPETPVTSEPETPGSPATPAPETPDKSPDEKADKKDKEDKSPDEKADKKKDDKEEEDTGLPFNPESSFTTPTACKQANSGDGNGQVCEISVALKGPPTTKGPECILDETEEECVDGRALLVPKSKDCANLECTTAECTENADVIASSPAYANGKDMRMAEFEVSSSDFMKFAQVNPDGAPVETQVCYLNPGNTDALKAAAAPSCEDAYDEENNCDAVAAALADEKDDKKNNKDDDKDDGLPTEVVVAIVVGVVAALAAVGFIVAKVIGGKAAAGGGGSSGGNYEGVEEGKKGKKGKGKKGKGKKGKDDTGDEEIG